MNKYLIFLLLLISLHGSAQSSGIIAGPMLGPVEYRDAVLWLEVSTDIKSVSVQYRKAGNPHANFKSYKGELGNEFNPIQLQIGGLDFNTDYEYTFYLNGKPSAAKGTFHTKDLWQWRKPAPDFTFLVGSCHYGNEPEYDRPGKPYGGDPSIFSTMAKEKSAFMLWTGDEWYTREVDYYSKWGLWYRAQQARKMPELQPFLKSMPQWAMWDDHDYGPNDVGSSYILKDESRKVFSSYFCNTSAGENGQGIYTMNSWGDADIFMLDGRWFRSSDNLVDSINGKPNPEKIMLGHQQMLWLKNALAFSTATFKLIMFGNQVLNPVSTYEKFEDFKLEYDELMQFLLDQKLHGVVFISGDRHHSEVIKVDRPGTYPLYDVTISPLTSGTHTFGGAEKNNPYRVVGVDQKQNYGRFTVSGKKNERVLKVDMVGVSGEVLGSWSVGEGELR